MENKQVLIWLTILLSHILQNHHFLCIHLDKANIFTHRNTNSQHKQYIELEILHMLNMRNHNQYTRCFQDKMIQDILKCMLTCTIFHFHNTKYMLMSSQYKFYKKQNIIGKPYWCLCNQVDKMSHIQIQVNI